MSPTPTPRMPVRPARGLLSDLRAGIASLREGEIAYAEDKNTLYVLRQLPSGARVLEPVGAAGVSVPAGMVFRYLGRVDARQATTLPPSLKAGDVVTVSADGNANAAWKGVGGTALKAGDTLIFDGTNWSNFGPAGGTGAGAGAVATKLQQLQDVLIGVATPAGEVFGSTGAGVWGVLPGIDLGRIP